jgi:hypothetical protein
MVTFVMRQKYEPCFPSQLSPGGATTNLHAGFIQKHETYCRCYPAWPILTGVPGNRLTMRYALDSGGYLHWIQVCSETCRYEPGRGRELRFESFDTVLRSLESVRIRPCLGCLSPDEYLPLLERQRSF